MPVESLFLKRATSRESLTVLQALVNCPPGLLLQVMTSFLLGRKRDLAKDARSFSKKTEIEVSGIENINRDESYYFYINHPDIIHLIGGTFAFIDSLFSLSFDLEKLKIVATDFGRALPWSNNIFSVPSKRHADFYGGEVKLKEKRYAVRQQIKDYLGGGGLILLAPEGASSKENRLNGKDSLSHGAGEIAVFCKSIGVQQVPVAICVEEEKTKVIIGKPFMVKSTNEKKAVVEMMERLSLMLPKKQRFA